MAVGVKKYNPGFLTDDEIGASFCVRTGESRRFWNACARVPGSPTPMHW